MEDRVLVGEIDGGAHADDEHPRRERLALHGHGGVGGGPGLRAGSVHVDHHVGEVREPAASLVEHVDPARHRSRRRGSGEAENGSQQRTAHPHLRQSGRDCSTAAYNRRFA